MARYLREFLSDPRVVRAPRLVWLPILNGIVIPRRRRRVAEDYARIWTEAGSPLLVHSRAAADALGSRLGRGFAVALGMRYGRPSLASALDELAAAGCGRIVAVPLFPQWSDTTNGTLEAALRRELARRRDAPALEVAAPPCDDPAYVEALARRIEEARGATPVDLHVLSFHGLPESYVRRGDPYRDQCQRTADALARRLGLERGGWELAFQSRFGPRPWLRPYLDELLAERAGTHPRALVAMPGFAADCLETLVEVGVGLRRAFLEAGGEELVVVPALNDSAPWIEALEGHVRRVAPGP